MMRTVARNVQSLMFRSQASFSGFGISFIIVAGPYNPMLYKDYLVPRAYPTNK